MSPERSFRRQKSCPSKQTSCQVDRSCLDTQFKLTRRRHRVMPSTAAANATRRQGIVHWVTRVAAFAPRRICTSAILRRRGGPPAQLRNMTRQNSMRQASLANQPALPCCITGYWSITTKRSTAIHHTVDWQVTRRSNLEAQSHSVGIIAQFGSATSGSDRYRCKVNNKVRSVPRDHGLHGKHG